MLTTNQCFKCKEIKPLSSFSACKQNKNGVLGICKVCSIKYQKEWYVKNKEHVKKYQNTNLEQIKRYVIGWGGCIINLQRVLNVNNKDGKEILRSKIWITFQGWKK